QEGAKVVAFDLSADRLKALRQELGEVAIVQGDVGNSTTIERRWQRQSRSLASSRCSLATPESMTGCENWKDSRTKKLKTVSTKYSASILKVTCSAPRQHCRS